MVALTTGGCGDDTPGMVNPGVDGAVRDGADSAIPASDASTMADAMMPALPQGCFDGEVEVSGAGERLSAAITPHYSLLAQADIGRTEGFARMLEAAWEEYARFFGAEPELSAGERLRVRFFRDHAAYRAGLAADGLSGVSGSGGYYEPSTSTAYLFDQPTRYFTQTLLLHEAAHQFHGRSRDLSSDLPFWYREGVAEYLSRHDWDGRCVRLGVRPLVTQEDSPAQALAMLESGAISMANLVDQSTPASRPLAYSMFRYFSHVDSGALATIFRRFRTSVDNGGDPMAAFSESLGTPASHDAPWLAFLRDDQEPMTTIVLEHAHIGPTSLDAFSEYFSIAIVKQPVTRFETSFRVPDDAGWSGGIVLGYEGPSRFEAIVVRESGRLQRFDVAEGARWNDVDAAPSSVDGRYAFAVAYSPGRVAVTINGSSWDFETTLPPISGVAVDSGSLRFEHIRWE